MSISIQKNGIFDPEGKYPNPLTGQPYSKSYKVLSLGIKSKSNPSKNTKGWSEYTAWKNRVEIIKKIHQNQILLLVLPTGVGKTVIIPKLLIHYFDYKKRVVVTVPRIAVGEEAGEYAALCLDVPLYQVDDNAQYIKDNNDNRYPTGNKIVGYRFRSIGSKFGDQNSILLFTTDGNIKQTIIGGDKDLQNYGGVIIDEAHERNLNIDVLIALVMDIVKRRPDFKVIIMSATIKKEIFTDYFKRIGLGQKYSTFDLPKEKTTFNIIKQPTMKNVNSNNIVDEVYKKINEVILDPKLPFGNILAFVTSESDIFKIANKISKNMNKYPVNNRPYTIGFNANIKAEIKSIAVGKVLLKDLKPTPEAPQGYSRKVIIATNAVESSITFKEPMVYIIDTGLAFEKNYDPKNYCYQTGKNLVSQASIDQRCGRTGRNCDGYCIQLYTTDQYNKLNVYTMPKILVEDFTNELLGLAIYNGNIPNSFQFMSRMIQETSTYELNIRRAYRNLLNMSLIDASGNVTNLGFLCKKFNDIQIGKMIICSYYFGCIHWCVMLGAILTKCDSFEKMFKKPPNPEDDPRIEEQFKKNIKRFINESGDHITLLNIFHNFISQPYESRFEYAKTNGLDNNMLLSIQTEYNNLYDTVTQQMTYIKNLNLFNVPPELLISGGYRKDKDSDEDNYRNDDGDDGDDDGDDDSIDSDIDDESNDSDFDIENDIDDIEEKEFNNFISNVKGGGIKYDDVKNDDVKGGGRDDDDHDNDDDDDDDSGDSDDELEDFEDDLNDSENEFDDIENIKKINIEYNKYKQSKINNIANGGNRNNRNNRNNNQENFQSTNIINKSSNESLNRNSNNSRRFTITNNKQKERNSKNNNNRKHTRKNMNNNMNNNMKNNMIGGSNDANSKKRFNIIELLNIPHIENLNLKPPHSQIDRILASLFFGFSNNIASYSGNSDKYNVKFSPKQASIESSSFDFINKNPDFIVYNVFTINKDMGSKGSKLSLVSEINSHHFGQFIDIHELKKKIKNM